LHVGPNGNCPLSGTRPTLDRIFLVALFVDGRFANQFGVAQFLMICRICYRIFTAFPPLRLHDLGPHKLMISALFYPGADNWN
jgi:hypothetical protein